MIINRGKILTSNLHTQESILTMFAQHSKERIKGLWLESEGSPTSEDFSYALSSMAKPPILKGSEKSLFIRHNCLSSSRSSEQSKNFPERKESLKFSHSYVLLITQIQWDYLIFTRKKSQKNMFTVSYFNSIPTVQSIAY